MALLDLFGDPLGGEIDQAGLRISTVGFEIFTARADWVVGVAQIGGTGTEVGAQGGQWPAESGRGVPEDGDGRDVRANRGGQGLGIAESRDR